MAIRRDINGEELSSRRLSTPNPDPTARTIEALYREISSLKDFYDSKFSASEKALALLQSNADKAPSISVVDEHVMSLANVMNEKFKGVDLQFNAVALQFKERDTRQDQTSAKDQTALKDALTAAKELVNLQSTSSALAIGKSEASTAGQISQIVATFNETTKGLADKMEVITRGITDKIDSVAIGSNDKIESVKDRIILLERDAKGTSSQAQGRHDTWGTIAAVIAAAGIIIGIVIGVMSYVNAETIMHMTK